VVEREHVYPCEVGILACIDKAAEVVESCVFGEQHSPDHIAGVIAGLAEECLGIPRLDTAAYGPITYAVEINCYSIDERAH
jgi:hypothetical protein